MGPDIFEFRVTGARNRRYTGLLELIVQLGVHRYDDVVADTNTVDRFYPIRQHERISAIRKDENYGIAHCAVGQYFLRDAIRHISTLACIARTNVVRSPVP